MVDRGIEDILEDSIGLGEYDSDDSYDSDDEPLPILITSKFHSLKELDAFDKQIKTLKPILYYDHIRDLRIHNQTNSLSRLSKCNAKILEAIEKLPIDRFKYINPIDSFISKVIESRDQISSLSVLDISNEFTLVKFEILLESLAIKNRTEELCLSNLKNEKYKKINPFFNILYKYLNQLKSLVTLKIDNLKCGKESIGHFNLQLNLVTLSISHISLYNNKTYYELLTNVINGSLNLQNVSLSFIKFSSIFSATNFIDTLYQVKKLSLNHLSYSKKEKNYQVFNSLSAFRKLTHLVIVNDMPVSLGNILASFNSLLFLDVSCSTMTLQSLHILLKFIEKSQTFRSFIFPRLRKGSNFASMNILFEFCEIIKQKIETFYLYVQLDKYNLSKKDIKIISAFAEKNYIFERFVKELYGRIHKSKDKTEKKTTIILNKFIQSIKSHFPLRDYHNYI